MLKDTASSLVRLPQRHDRPLRLGVVANTYGTLPADVAAHLAGVDLILHAGDVGEMSVITRLEAIAPVFAVAGDHDRITRFPLHRLLRINGRKIALTHGHAVHRAGGALRALFGDEHAPTWDERYADILAAFPPVDCVVFAHPAAACRIHEGRTLILNPGAVAAGDNGRHFRAPSLGVIDLGRSVEGHIVQLGGSGPLAPSFAPAR